MGKKKKVLFDSDDEACDEKIQVNKSFAKCYDDYRSKEELQKYKDRYGDIDLNENGDSSDSSEESDDSSVNAVLDEEFFTTLSHIKSKNPIIYDKDAKFSSEKLPEGKKEKKKQEKPMHLRDYERNILMNSKNSNSGTDSSQTYIEEQKELKSAFKEFVESSESEDDELLKIRPKENAEKIKEDSEYIKWLKGEDTIGLDNNLKTNLKPLHDFWNNPKLDTSEQFLKDYILNKRYLENEDDTRIPAYDEIVHESDENLSADEEALNEQALFEEKYNFRFEEPDPEFIKRYPRSMEDTMRRKDSKRKQQRENYKERKEEEKKKKREEMKQLKALKRKEIMDRLQQISEITGNPNTFNEFDLDADFDPAAHDNKMKQTFSEEFYSQEDHEKPAFSDEEQQEENQAGESALEENEAHSSNSAMKSHRFYSMMKEARPKFDPSQQDYEQYLEEYYKLDFEDLIGDTPCRFKYRKVVPNDFGLDTEEILLAKEKELNKWCSLKKSVQYKTVEDQKREVKNYSNRRTNVNLKRKILPSLFGEEDDDQIKHTRASQPHKKTKAPVTDISDNRLRAYGLNPKRYKNKLKYKN